MRPHILVINPNSDTNVTQAIADGCALLNFPDGPELRFTTLKEGPRGVETQADYERIPLPLRALVASNNEASAFVVACFSDPGLHVCREATDRPVFGIAESGLLHALTRGTRLGVIAIKQVAVKRHLRYMRQIGLIDRLAGERPLDMSVAESASEGTLTRMIEVGETLRDKDGADVIVMGCAGMSRHRRKLEAALGIPVIDPSLAAVAMAIGTVQANL